MASIMIRVMCPQLKRTSNLFRHCQNGHQSVLFLSTSGSRRRTSSEEISSSSSPTTSSQFSEMDLNQVLESATSVGEPTLRELGLGSAFPSGLLQTLMETFHIQLDLPWWGSIVATTLTLRILLFPVVLKAQRNMIKMNHLMPEQQKLQMAAMKAETREEHLKASLKVRTFMKENGVDSVGPYLPVLGQGAVFLSMFLAIRGMASLPVESMKVGGLAWFTDLTICDPYFLLPVITATSVYVNILVGADGIDPNSMPPFFRKLIMAMPIISLPIMCQFPAALNVYWLSTNLISIAQTKLIRHKTLRKKLGLGEIIVWDEKDLPLNAAFKDAFSPHSASKSNFATNDKGINVKQSKSGPGSLNEPIRLEAIEKDDEESAKLRTKEEDKESSKSKR